MQILANTIEKTGMNKNKGIRCPIKISDFQDVNIVSFSVEKNHPHSSVSSQRDFAYYTIRYILKGYGTATYNGVKTRLKPDMLFVTYPNSNSTIVQDGEDPYTLAWFVCDGAKVKKILHRIGINSSNLFLQLAPNDKLRNLFAKTPGKCKNNISRSDVIALSAFYTIMDLILEQVSLPENNSSKAVVHVNTAMQYVQDHYNDPMLTVLRVSREIGIAPKYLSRIFKQEAGVDLGHYITNRRLSAATELMQTCNYSIQEIATMCGFMSPYYFSQVYKKYNSIPPSAAMKQYKAQKRLH